MFFIVLVNNPATALLKVTVKNVEPPATIVLTEGCVITNSWGNEVSDKVMGNDKFKSVVPKFWITNVWTILVLINALSFAIYGWDKFLAVKNKRRVSEFNLLLLTGIGGTIGGLLAMYFFKHKTSKFSFMLMFYSILILQIILLYFGIQTFKS